MTEAEDALQRMRAAHQNQCRAEAGLLRDVAELAEVGSPDQAVAVLVDRCSMDRQRARDVLDLAVAVTTSMSATLAAMDAGSINQDRAMEIYKVVRHFSGEAAARAKETELLNQRFG